MSVTSFLLFVSRPAEFSRCWRVHVARAAGRDRRSATLPAACFDLRIASETGHRGRAHRAKLSSNKRCVRCRRRREQSPRQRRRTTGFDAFKLHDALQSLRGVASDRRCSRRVRNHAARSPFGLFFRRVFGRHCFLYRDRSFRFDASLGSSARRLSRQLTRTILRSQAGAVVWPRLTSLSPHWLPSLRLPRTRSPRVLRPPGGTLRLTSDEHAGAGRVPTRSECAT